jgi:hypothetical protein
MYWNYKRRWFIFCQGNLSHLTGFQNILTTAQYMRHAVRFNCRSNDGYLSCLHYVQSLISRGMERRLVRTQTQLTTVVRHFLCLSRTDLMRYHFKFHQNGFETTLALGELVLLQSFGEQAFSVIV